ncbi:MAG: lipoate--protein ligase family protein [Candidatus Ratteibacteria bacterium]|jgi:lipoate-protein ligase A
MSQWRLLSPAFRSPYENMAIDEALLDSYLLTGIPIFRLYGWMPSGFSVGYSQEVSKALDLALCKRDKVPVVRRMTGGGAIYHCREITYSLVCSPEDIGSPSSVRDGYRAICAVMMKAYASLGLSPKFASDTGTTVRSQSSFCFASHSDSDIVVEGKKIGGNAQRRMKGAIFQHGSIPLENDLSIAQQYLLEPIASSQLPVASLSELLGRSISFDEMAEVLRKSFVSYFPSLEKEEFLSEEEENKALHLVEKKYGLDAWNLLNRTKGFLQ